MKIIGIDGMTSQQIHDEIDQGAKFVIYSYCISVIVMTFRRSSDIYFIKPGQNSVVKGLALSTNLSGGKDVTTQIRNSLNIHELTN